MGSKLTIRFRLKNAGIAPILKEPLLSSLMKFSAALTRPLLVVALLCAGPTGFAQNAPANTGADGILLDKPSKLRNLVPAEQLERSAAQQFAQMKRSAEEKNALAPNDHPQLIKLKEIAKRLLPYTARWNSKASSWNWEVQLFGSNAINAFCMPGGKIGFYTGIIDKLKLTDDEIAMVMGHEMAHALREHSRERLAKNQLTGIGAGVLSAVLGLGAHFSSLARTPLRSISVRSPMA